MRVHLTFVLLGGLAWSACGRAPVSAIGDGAPSTPDGTSRDVSIGPRADRGTEASTADGRADDRRPDDLRTMPPDLAADSLPPPSLADLTIKQFDAVLNGADINYTVNVCNQGTAAAFLFRVEVYYNRALPPGPLQVGDFNQLVLYLAPGACQSFSHTYKGPMVGLYNSWAFADTLGTVKEADENNNVGGPKLVLVTAPTDCIAVCAFATSCDLYSITEFPQCLTLCNQLNPSQKNCATGALQARSCTDLTACKLPPLPPPPPPPWDCLPLCNYLIDTCSLLPESALVTCVGGCLTLPATKLQCGLDAMNKKQCLQMAICIF